MEQDLADDSFCLIDAVHLSPSTKICTQYCIEFTFVHSCTVYSVQNELCVSYLNLIVDFNEFTIARKSKSSKKMFWFYRSLWRLLLLPQASLIFQCLVGTCHQILFLSLSEFVRINFYSFWDLQKTCGFLMILGGIEVN